MEPGHVQTERVRVTKAPMQQRAHTCLTSGMENRPSYAQLTSNTLYTPQTVHFPGIAFSGPLKEALCQHFTKHLKKPPASTNALSH